MKTKLIMTAATALLIAPVLGYSQYSTPVTSPTVKATVWFTQLPAAVQAAAQQQAAGREIVKITAGTWDGQPGYCVEFKEKGRNPDVYIAANGALIRPQEKPPALFVGTTFEKLPAAAQDSLRRQVGSGEITRIDKEGHKSTRFYRVNVIDQQGLSYQLQVSEDGRILQDTRIR